MGHLYHCAIMLIVLILINNETLKGKFMITVIEFTPIFSETAQKLVDQGSLCGGVETAPDAEEALRRFQAYYDDGQVVDVEQLSYPFQINLATYKEFHEWDWD